MRRGVPMATTDLFIIDVELCDESRKTHHVLNDGNPDLYPVTVYFNRHVDEFERRELAEFGIVRENKDRMCALIADTTQEHIRDHLDEHNEVLASAVERARLVGEDAEAEAARLFALKAEINNGILAAQKERLFHSQ
ncbi:MAG: hypothetical protein JWR34_5092 [Mycobacterium sp.]|jgi:hypothetical protein|nr:hypothetical protein [Mycobacterium sp.]